MTDKTFERSYATIEVHVADYRCTRQRLPTDPLARKRAAIWTNHDRNAAIAAIADGLIKGDLQSLWPFGLFVGRQHTQASVPFLRPNWLCVVVENLEHAAELQKILPHLAIDRAYPPEPAGWQPRAIVTMARIGDYRMFTPTVLINAVGGQYELELPKDFAVRSAGTPGLVVELSDEYDDQASKDTTRRLMQYGYRRWPVFPEHRLAFSPLDIPTRGRATKSAYERRVEKWKAASTEQLLQPPPSNNTSAQGSGPPGEEVHDA